MLVSVKHVIEITLSALEKVFRFPDYAMHIPGLKLRKIVFALSLERG